MIAFITAAIRRWLRAVSFLRSRASDPGVRYTAGSGSGLLKVARSILPTNLFDRAVRKTFALDQQ